MTGNARYKNGLFIIIPYFNEASVISGVMQGLGQFPNIVIIDDGSSPALQNKWPNVTVLRHRVNLGQGAALQTGLEYGLKNGAGFFVTFDADGQHDPADISRLYQALRDQNTDVVLGSRFYGIDGNIPPGRKRLLKLSRFVNYLFTGLYLTDAHNGLRAFSREAAEKVRFKENRMAHATEFLSIIKKNRLKFIEIPVNVQYTEYSRQKGQSPFNSIRIFFDLVLHKLFE